MNNFTSFSLRNLFIALVLFCASFSAKANHVVGVDLNYSWVSGNTYKISLVVYGDCGNSTFPYLTSSVPVICIYNAGTYVTNLALTVEYPSSGIKMTPVCVSDTDSTTCTNLSYPIVGIKKFTYSANYTLPSASQYWRFIFNGDMGLSSSGASSAGRQSTIDNISGAGTSIICLIDTLNNLYHNNNSPNLTVIPTPYFCLNNSDNYNPGAVDPDGDSLRFALIPGQVGLGYGMGCSLTGSFVTYVGTAYSSVPVSDTIPLKVRAGSYSFDRATGHISFNPNFAQRALVVYNIREFRNDTFIGTSQREMVFLVQTCSVAPPTAIMSGATGAGSSTDSVTYQICQNFGAFTFNVNPTMPDTTKQIYVSVSGVPTGATFTVTGDSTNRPTCLFSWTSTGVTPGTYPIRVTFRDNNCPIPGSNTVTFFVVIGAPPPTITGTLTLCAGSVTSLTNSSAGGRWTSGTTTVATIGSSTGVVSGVSVGTSAITYTLPTGCRTTTTVTVTSPLPGITGTAAVCAGSLTTLTNSTAGGTWTSGTPTVATIGSSSGIVTGVAAGTSTITYATGPTCTATRIVTVYPLPTAILGVSTVCAGLTVTLSDTTAGGTWTSSAGVTVGTSTGIVTGGTPGTSTITYTLPTGCRVTASMTVYPSPVPISGVRGICLGLSSSLSDATAGGTWSSSAPFIATIGTSGVVTGSTVGTATISYSISGCAAITAVTVYPLPSPIIGLINVCEGATLSLASASVGGTWSSSTTSVATIGSTTGVVSGVSAGTTTITYTLPTGCIATTIITVNPTPAPISGTTTICVGRTTTLSTTSTGGVWSSSNVTRASVGATTGIVSGVAGGTAIISYSFSSGCSATTLVTVNPPPGTITGLTNVCAGTTATYSNSVAGGTWESSNTTVATVGSTTGYVTGVTPGTAILSYILPTGCFSITTITISPVPAPISGLTSVCVGGRVTLSNTTAGGNWISGNTAIATVVSTTGVVTGVSAGTVVITYRIFTTGCIATTTVTVTSPPGPIGGTASVCIGATSTLTNSVAGGAWSSSSIGVASIGTAGDMHGVSAGTSIITYSLGTTCQVTRTVTVTPAPSAISGSLSLCIGASSSLSNAVAGGTWTSSNTSVATIGSSSGFAVGVSVGTSIISYTIGTGCSVSATLTITSGPGAISGALGACIGSAVTLSSIPGGGTWTSGSTGIATVETTTGIARGLSAGTSLITYSLGGGCQVTRVLSVYPAPVAHTVSGGGGYCIGGSGVLIGLSSSTIGTSYVLLLGGTPVGSPVAGTGSALSFGLQTTAGTYTVVATTIATGCTATMTGSATVTINPLPSPITGATTVCVGASTTLASPGGGTWSSSASSVASVGAGTGIVTGGTTGTATITYTLPTGCYTTTVVTVSLSPGPILGPTTVCMGMTATLTDAVSGGLWSASCAALTIGSTTGEVSGLAVGTCTITYSLGSGCTVYRAMAVTPGPSAISGGTAVCVGAALTLSNAVAGGTWSSSSTATATIGTSGIVTGVAIGTSTITYSLGTGCFVTTTVSVSPAPGVIAGTGSVCMGSTITLTNSASGGVWSTSSSTVATIGTSGIVTGVSAGSATISYSLGSGCTVSRTITVTPAPGPILGPTAMCLGASITLSNATAGGTWASSNGTVASVNVTSGVVAGLSIGTATISYSIGIGCPSILTVTVNPAPTAILGTPVVCAGASTTLSNAVSGGTWTSSTTAVATVTSTTGYVSGVSWGTATITYSLGGSCFSTIITTVHPIAPISGTTSLCSGRTATLSDAITGGIWVSSSTGVVTIGSSSGIITGITPGTSFITYTLPTGCLVTTIISVNSVPAAIAGTLHLCVGTTSPLSNATTGGTWMSSAPSIATIGASTGVLGGMSAGIFGSTATITYSLGSGCLVTAVATVAPLPAPILGSLSACVGVSTTLSSGTSGGSWSVSTGGIATTSGTSGIIFGLLPGTALVTYTLPTGCIRQATLTVRPLPSPITGTTSLCAGTTTTLANADAVGSWASSDLTVATISSVGVVSGVAAGTATISYAVGGCPATTTVTVIPPPSSISGPSSVCVGTTVTMSSTSTGGTWSSGSTTTATINPVSGVLMPRSSGTVVISYTVGTGCRTISSIVVNPISPISGFPIICTGQYTTLFDTTMGGTWSTSNPAIATAIAVTMGSGRVYGVSPGAVTITYTTSAGCRALYPVTVRVTPTPILGVRTICRGYTSTLSNATPGGVWASSHPLTAPVDAAGVVTGSGIGPATISYTIAGCSAGLTVTVQPLPGVIFGNTDVCEGSTTTLSDPAGGGGTWSSGALAIATAGTFTGVVGGVAAGISPISYTLPTGCFNITNVNVNALPAPITGPANVCLGHTATLNSATPGGVWTSNNPSVASIDLSTGVVYGNAAGFATIFYRLSTTGCTISFLLTVNNPPPASFGPNRVCEGSQITLVNSLVGGSWFSSDTTIATAGISSGIITGIAGGSVLITYTVGTGCSTFKNIDVDPLPAPITGITSVCEGQTTTLSTSTFGGSWFSSAPSIATIDASGIVSGILAGTSAITYLLPTGCLITNTITVNPMPSTISGPNGICLGSTVTMTNSVAGGLWTSPASTVSVGATSGLVTGIAVGAANITYTLGAGCTVTKAVNVVPLPVQYTVTGGGNFCAGGAGVPIGLNGSTIGVNYLLYLGSTPVGTFPGTGSSLSFGLHVVPGTYYVVGTSAASSCRNTMLSTATVVVDPTVVPTVTISPAPSGTVCEGTSVTFSATLTSGGSSPTYQWQVNGVNVTTGPSYSFIPANGDLVHVHIRSNANCALPDTASANLRMTVDAYQLPIAVVTPTPGDTVCLGDAVTLRASHLYGGTAPYFRWLRNGAFIGTGNVISYVPADGDLVYVDMASNYPCRTADTVQSASLMMHVDTQIVPEVLITANPGYMTWFGTNTTLTANVVKGGDAPKYQWVINGVPILGATNATYSTTAFNNNDSVSCQVTSSGYCPVTSHNWMYMLVSPLGSNTLPTATSWSVLPNPTKGTFAIKGQTGTLQEATVTVTNLLGQEVYKKNAAAKNGTINETITLNSSLPNGMYLVTLKYGQQTKVFHIVLEQ